MKRWLLLHLMVLLGIVAGAQSAYKLSSKGFILLQDSFLIDTAVLMHGSIKVHGYMENIDFRINYYHSAFINLQIPKGSFIQMQYAPMRYPIKQVYRNRDYALVQPEFSETINPFKLSNDKGNFDAIMKSEGLVTNGSIMRGLSVGNSQNAVINANLNLQLAGRINNEVDVLAAISDENNPIQPEGNTQELQDFDRVFVQFSKAEHKLVVGDYLMSKPAENYFLNYYKKSRGLSAETQFGLNQKQQLKIGAQAALSRGRFVRNTINGIEGNQGPYRLTGSNGELFIILISGTESVYLDGQKLTRGEQNDYTIDYNSGELVFMPRRLITQYSRIIVEFQYSDRNFARTVFALQTKWETKKSSVYLNYFTEQDNKNQPFQQNLSDSNKLLLSQVGDNLAQAKVLSEVPHSAFQSKLILYRKRDTLAFGQVYVHTTDASSDSVFYEVRFSFVGAGKGNYKQSSSTSNGRVFEWIAPVNGLPQGDFEPFVQLIAPNRKQMLVLGASHIIKEGHLVKMELAKSDFDQNLYSELNKSNDAGYAVKLEWSNELKLGNSSNLLKSNIRYEYTSQHFQYVERYRNVEFARMWNRQLNNLAGNDTGAKEHILNWQLGFETKEHGFLRYQLGYYNRADGNFLGLNHQVNSRLMDSKNSLDLDGEWLHSNLKAIGVSDYGNEVRRMQGAYTRSFSFIRVGALVQTEKSAFKQNGDSLLNGSFAFKKFGLFLKSKDSSQLSYFMEANMRLDLLPLQSEFKDHTLAKEIKAGMSVLQKNFNKLNLDVSFRDFQVLDSAFQHLKPEQTLLSRVEYDYAFFKRLITANTYVQLGSGNELRRDYQYLEVPVGQGIYVWKDFNEDGAQQLNEFQAASFADKNLANYIKVYLPTTSLIKIQSTQFSQTLNINSFANRKLLGFMGFLSRFSDQAALRLDRKVQANSDNVLLTAVNWNLQDTSIISLSSLLRNTLFFNRNNPRYGLDFGWNQGKSKMFQTNGFESRNKSDYSFGGRYNLNANWTLSGAYVVGDKAYFSQIFSSNNYRFSYTEIKPKISYQFLQTWRLSLDYALQQSLNKAEYGGDKSEVNQVGTELRYSFVKIGVLTFKYSYYQVQFNGNINSPLAYDMLQGLSIGKNQLWSLSVQQRIGQNLQINLSYDGRKSGLIPVIHTGKMEARYLF
ncbi:MAG: hypothetical protein SGJ00_03865 [bacterium]|nr:hypothetical protein [bacterium]